MRPISIAAVSVLVCVMAASCATTPSAPVTSWGKPNVTLLQYWSDSAACALAGAEAEVTLSIPNYGLVRNATPIADPGVGGRVNSDDPSIIDTNDSIMRARLNELQQLRNDQSARQSVIDQCLTERGYSRYQLSAAQASELRQHEEGSRERREYLHRLGSDPAVLAAQGL